MAGPLTFVAIFSFLFSQAFALGLHPLKRQASSTALPTSIPTTFPAACLDPCNDVTNTVIGCYTNAIDFNSCYCTQAILDGSINCGNCEIDANSGPLSPSGWADAVNGYVTYCDSLGLAFSSVSLGPSSTFTPPSSTPTSSSSSNNTSSSSFTRTPFSSSTHTPPSSPTNTPSNNAGTSRMAMSLSLLGCMISLVLGAGMVFI